MIMPCGDCRKEEGTVYVGCKGGGRCFEEVWVERFQKISQRNSANGTDQGEH